MSSTNLRTK